MPKYRLRCEKGHETLVYLDEVESSDFQICDWVGECNCCGVARPNDDQHLYHAIDCPARGCGAISQTVGLAGWRI